ENAHGPARRDVARRSGGETPHSRALSLAEYALAARGPCIHERDAAAPPPPGAPDARGRHRRRRPTLALGRVRPRAALPPRSLPACGVSHIPSSVSREVSAGSTFSGGFCRC